MCGPRGLPPDGTTAYHNNGDGTFTDVSEKSGFGSPALAIPSPPSPMTLTTTAGPTFTWRGLATQHAVPQQPRRHVSPTSPTRGVAYSDNGHEQAGMGVAVGDYDLRRLVRYFQDEFR